MNSPPKRPVSITSFTIRRPTKRTINVHVNNSENQLAAAQRRARLEETRASFNRNRNERDLAAAQTRAEQIRTENAAQLASQVGGIANRLSNSNASRSQARKALTNLRHNPAALRRVSLAVLLSLFVFAGYAAQAMRAIANTRGNASAKNALFKLNQRVGR